MQVDARFLPLALDVRSETSLMAAISANEKPQKNFKSTISASAGSALASSSSASTDPSSFFHPAFSTSVSSEVISNRPPRF